MAGDPNSKIHGTTGSGESIPISAIKQESQTSLLFTRMGRDNFASSTHPRMSVTSHTVSKPLPVICALDDVIAQTGFLITADSSNTVNAMIGGASVSSTNGIPLVAGQSIMLDITRMSRIYAIAAADPSSGTCNLFWLDM